jgi:hypothetical protein
MIYDRRVHFVGDVATVEELAEKLTSITWTLCTGFRLRHGNQVLLFLNDSMSEDGAQEYAVFSKEGLQLESITFGWCDQATAAQHIREVLSGEVVQMGHYELRIDTDPNHSCHLCW